MSKVLYVFLVIAACSSCSVFAAPLASQYDHSAYLDATENFELHWTVDRSAKKIKFATEVKTKGYTGFGLSEGLSGRMLRADIVMGWVDAEGKGHLQDMYGVGHKIPELDASSDYKLTGSQENNGVTVLQFERSFDTCDKEHDHKITDGTMKVIWSYSDTDPKIGDKSTFAYHKSRGARSLNLLNYVKNTANLPGLKYFDVLQPDIEVPSADTTYFCMAHKLPDLGGRKHIVEIAPIIQKGNEGLVHHMVLFECSHDFPDKHINKSGSCYSTEMPVELRQCSAGGASVFAWAVGGTNFKFPDHVGLGIGGKGDMMYVVMETHYDNPQLRKGLRDSSGLRFYYTDTIRQYDGATLYVNQASYAAHVIPPKKKDWISTGYCPSAVTKRPGVMNSTLTNNAIKIFAAFPHAHLAGRALWLKHIKEDGTEYPEIFRDNNYDFNFQQTNVLPEERTFYPGEAMNVYCKYDTMDRTDAVVGGISTREEMCFFFLLYYPKQEKFTSCSSDYEKVLSTFTPKYATRKNNSMYTWYSWKDVAWNESMVEELQKIYEGKIVSVRIGTTNGSTLLRDVPITEVKTPYVPVTETCSSNHARCVTASLAFTLLFLMQVLFITLR